MESFLTNEELEYLGNTYINDTSDIYEDDIINLDIKNNNLFQNNFEESYLEDDDLDYIENYFNDINEEKKENKFIQNDLFKQNKNLNNIDNLEEFKDTNYIDSNDIEIIKKLYNILKGKLKIFTKNKLILLKNKIVFDYSICNWDLINIYKINPILFNKKSVNKELLISLILKLYFSLIFRVSNDQLNNYLI